MGDDKPRRLNAKGKDDKVRRLGNQGKLRNDFKIVAMSESPPSALDRAIFWIELDQADRAEQEYRRALLEEPENSSIHAMLSLCLIELDRAKEATEEAKLAINLGPEEPLGHFALAASYVRRGRAEEARQANAEARRLDPDDPDMWMIEAQIELLLRQWTKASDAAKKGLALDPDHAECTNLLAAALAQQGAGEISIEASKLALAQNPEDATSHYVAGFIHLQHGDLQQAGDHFRESLRLDPNSDEARSGLVSVLKAQNFFFRQAMRFSMWLLRQSGLAIGIFVIGFWLLLRTINFISNRILASSFILAFIGQMTQKVFPILFFISCYVMLFSPIFLKFIIDIY